VRILLAALMHERPVGMTDSPSPRSPQIPVLLRELVNALTVASGHEQLIRRRAARDGLALDPQLELSLVAIEQALTQATYAARALALHRTDRDQP
jgi:hypothetical protein